MKLPRHELAALLAHRSLGRIKINEFSEEIAAYLLTEHRSNDLAPLLRDIMQFRADNGIVEVIAVSARPLTSAARADISAKVRHMHPSAKEIIVTEELDEGVIGGVRIEFANEQWDLSVRAKLNRFKQLTAAGKE
jgi:F0F1-type ATP synthase delta subunit